MNGGGVVKALRASRKHHGTLLCCVPVYTLTLGVLKGASKLNVLLLLLHVYYIQGIACYVLLWLIIENYGNFNSPTIY